MESAEATGFFLTSEELAVLVFLQGGECHFSEALGIAIVESEESPLFDFGFRSLLVRGLVRIDGSSVRLHPVATDLGQALVSPTDAWAVGLGYTDGSDAAAFLTVGARTIVLIPGPAGVFSTRTVAATAIEELTALVLNLADSVSAGAPAEEQWEVLAVAQRLTPQVSEPTQLVVTSRSDLNAVVDGKLVPLSTDGLESFLLESAEG